jgi:hypothetical protein
MTHSVNYKFGVYSWKVIGHVSRRCIWNLEENNVMPVRKIYTMELEIKKLKEDQKKIVKIRWKCLH